MKTLNLKIDPNCRVLFTRRYLYFDDTRPLMIFDDPQPFLGRDIDAPVSYSVEMLAFARIDGVDRIIYYTRSSAEFVEQVPKHWLYRLLVSSS